MASVTSYTFPTTNDNSFVDSIVTHLRNNAVDENGTKLFNRVEEGNSVPFREVTPDDCNACLIYRGDPWQGDVPVRQFFVGMDSQDLLFHLFIYCASDGQENPISIDAMWSGLIEELLNWLQIPNDGSTEGMNWYTGSNGKLLAELAGNQTITFEKTNKYIANGQQRDVKYPIFSGVLRIKAKVWSQAS